MSDWTDDCLYCVAQHTKALKLAGAPLSEILYVEAGRMYLCPDCGNKRCPKGTYHLHACTGSNDTGQPGSVYAGIGCGTPGCTCEEWTDAASA